MTGRLSDRLCALARQGEKGLIVYLTAYDPDRERSLTALQAAVRGGADVLEVGVPWSDPSADGPVIQQAMQRGLRAGSSLAGVLDLVAELRQRSEVPIVLFGYYNPVLIYGPARFARAAAHAGVDAVLVVDLPPEEAEELDGPLRETGLVRIPLIGPTTPPDRAARLCCSGAAGGFAYYIARTGVTGAGHLALDAVAARTTALRAQVPLPLCVGFGVQSPETARALARLPGCDAVVVGSAVVQAAARGEDVEALVRQLKAATRSGQQSGVSGSTPGGS